MKIRTIIAEDQSAAREGLNQLMVNESDFEVVALAKNGIEAIEMINELRPDLILLDIQMPGATGFEVLSSIEEQWMPGVIFISAYDEFALKAFEINAIDYLLKPYAEERLKEALAKVRASILSRSLQNDQAAIKRLLNYHQQQLADEDQGKPLQTEKDRFLIKEQGRIHFVPFADIIWVEAFDYYCKLYTDKRVHLIRKPMKTIEQELPAEFVRIHRSFIVRTDQISQVEKSTYGAVLSLNNGHSLNVSQKYWKLLKAKLQA